VQSQPVQIFANPWAACAYYIKQELEAILGREGDTGPGAAA
jgi:hypothetical protein